MARRAKRAAPRRAASSSFRLTAPKQATFLISLAIAIVALIGWVAPVLALVPYAFWLLVIAYVVLALSVVLRDF